MKYLMAVVFALPLTLGMALVAGALFQSWVAVLSTSAFTLGFQLDVLLRGSGRKDGDA